MTIINKDLYAPSTVANGLKSVTDDIQLIESYHTSAISAGMESLDYPAGKLIEQSLAAKYPGDFHIGSGMEGIAGLLSNLKTTASNVKNALKGKSRADLVAKPTADAMKAVDKQYSSGFWGGWITKEVEVVKPTGLLSLVKGGAFSEVKSQVDEYLGNRDAELKAATNGALEYWDNILPVFKKMKTEKDLSVLNECYEQLVKYSETTKMKDEPPEELPKTGRGGTLPPLHEDEAKQAVDYIKTLLERTKSVYKIVEPIYGIGINDDDNDGYLYNLDNIDGAPNSNYIFKIYNWRVLTDNIFGYTEEVRDYMLDVIKGLEDWIEKSNK